MTDIERIKNRVNEYCKSFRNKVIIRYDNIDETDMTIRLYVKHVSDTAVNFCLYAMIDLDINKRLEIYEEVFDMIFNYQGRPIVEFNGLNYGFRYADYRDSIIMQVNFFQALYYANFLNRPELYRKILEIGGEKHFKKVKMLLNTGGLYINSVECRAELIDYINKHSEKEGDLEL